MKRGYLPARFVLESALLMGMILPMITALLLAGFYVHDKAYLQASACEGAALAGAMTMDKAAGKKIRTLMKERVENGPVWAEKRNCHVQTGKSGASVKTAGTFRVILSEPFWSGSMQIQETWSRKNYCPSDLIRKVRGVQALLGMWEEK